MDLSGSGLGQSFGQKRDFWAEQNRIFEQNRDFWAKQNRDFWAGQNRDFWAEQNRIFGGAACCSLAAPAEAVKAQLNPGAVRF